MSIFLFSANPSVLTLTAVKHRVEGTIVAAESKNDVVVNIKYDHTTQLILLFIHSCGFTSLRRKFPKTIDFGNTLETNLHHLFSERKCNPFYRSFAAGEKPVDLGPLKAEPNKDEKKAPGQKFVYRFHYWAK